MNGGRLSLPTRASKKKNIEETHLGNRLHDDGDGKMRKTKQTRKIWELLKWSTKGGEKRHICPEEEILGALCNAEEASLTCFFAG